MRLSGKCCGRQRSIGLRRPGAGGGQACGGEGGGVQADMGSGRQNVEPDRPQLHEKVCVAQRIESELPA